MKKILVVVLVALSINGFAQQKEIARLAEIARVAEIARLTLIEKNDFIALELWTKINNKKIADEKAEIKRLAAVKEVQRIAAEIAENQRLELIQEQQELQRVTEVNRLQRNSTEFNVL